MRSAWLFVLSLLLTACSHEALQRTGYETLRNIEQQRCLEQEPGACPPREDYDEYQRRREELKQ